VRVYQVPQGSGKKAQEWFFESDAVSAGRMERELSHFRGRLLQVENALKMNLLRERHTSVRRLGFQASRRILHDDLCRYIRYCARGCPAIHAAISRAKSGGTGT
jgi:hypothetical protein